MKKLMVLALLLATQSSFAKSLGYICTVVNPQDAMEIHKLKLPGYMAEIGILSVNPKLCGLPVAMIYRDACNIKGHTLIVGLTPYDSSLTTKKGKTYDLVCEEDMEVRPMPSHGGGH